MESLPAQVAVEVGASPADTRILAAPGADVESLRPWASDLRAHFVDASTEISLIGVNLGNDLDEMYFGRETGHARYSKMAVEWLTTHSYFALDLALLRNWLLGEEWTGPPGANPVLFSLSDPERTEMARATAAAILKLVATLPPSQHTVVIVFPADYQIEPGQFDKYRKFYQSDSQFNTWRLRISEAAHRLDKIEETLSTSLAIAGVQAVSVKGVLTGQDLGALLDAASHHLTSRGYEMVARAVAQAVKREQTGGKQN
jgi:hypothetical protein